MIDFPAIGKALSDIGGWAAFLSLVVAIAVTGIRRTWVFGWMYDRLDERAKISDTQAEQNAESLSQQAVAHTQQAKAVKDLADAFKVMARSYDRIDVRLEALERRGARDE